MHHMCMCTDKWCRCSPERHFLRPARRSTQWPKHDAKIVIGDFNAKIGKESCYRGTIGMQSLHQITTDNGERLVTFAASRELIVSITCFAHKNIHKGTWKVPGTNITNQIDHVLIDSRHAPNILDVRTFRDPSCSSDHFLVPAKVRAKISMAKTKRQQELKGFNTEALKSKETFERFSRKVTQNLQAVQTAWLTARRRLHSQEI